MSLTQRASTRLRVGGGFAKPAVALIRQMEDYGWTGRIGTNNHAFMLAPDGVTTSSVSPKEGSPRHRGNQAAIFKAWLKQMEEMSAESLERAELYKVEMAAALSRVKFARRFMSPTTPLEALVDIAIPDRIPERSPELVPAPVDTAPEPEPVRAPGMIACGICGREFAGRQPLSVHHVRSHVKVACPVCDRQMAPGNLPLHQRTQHPPRPAEELQREVLQLRQEVNSWQALAEEAEESMAEMTRLAEEAEGRYAALRERYNAVVEAACVLQDVIER